MRTGRQKAAKIKQRIIQACEETGLTVQGAKYHIRHEYGDRFIQVAVVDAGGSCRNSAIDIYATVGLDGRWSGCFGIVGKKRLASRLRCPGPDGACSWSAAGVVSFADHSASWPSGSS